MLIPSLLKRMNSELPGETAHAEMAHLGRGVKIDSPKDAKLASVLALLYQKDNEWHTVLMKRTSRFENDKHKGQISFPGGQSESFDKDKAATALRETEEEIGIPSPEIEVIGALTELYIPVSNFLVQPYIGFMNKTPIFKPDSNEVDEVIEISINDFLNPINIRTTNLKINAEFTLNDVPYYNANGHIVWGATSMIISELIQVLKESGFGSKE